MGFVPKLAEKGLFGLTGLAATGAFKKDKKEKPQPTMITAQQPPSLINRPSIY